MLSGYEVASRLDIHLTESSQLLGRYAKLREQIGHDVAHYQGEARAAFRDLAAAYLPELSAEAFDAVAKLTGFRGFARRNTLQVLERERTVRQHTITNVLRNPEYQQRRSLVGMGGAYSQALREAEEMLAPWEEACARFESQPRWAELLETRYDTPEFSVSWLSPRYWKLWAAGDAICEALEMDDFGDDVLPAFREVDGHRQKWRAEVAAAKAKVDGVHELVRKHDQAVQELPHLEETVHNQAVDGLGEFLESADAGLLESWLPEDHPNHRTLLVAIRRAAGLSARASLLTQLEREAIGADIQAIQERSAKHRRKREKFLRPKRANTMHAENNADPKYTAKRAKFSDRIESYGRILQKMRAYDRYERFSVDDNDPELWWRELTGGRPPRKMTRLRAWYDRNPDARVRKDTARVAAEAVSRVVAQQPTTNAMDYLS